MDIQDLVNQLTCCQSQEEYDALLAAYGISEAELSSMIAAVNGANFLTNDLHEPHACIICGSSELQWEGSSAPRDGSGVMYQTRYLCEACRNHLAHMYNAATGEMHWEY